MTQLQEVLVTLVGILCKKNLVVHNSCTTVETTRFAPLKLDSPPLIFIYCLPYENGKHKKLASIEAIIAPSNGGYMKKAQHWD